MMFRYCGACLLVFLFAAHAAGQEETVKESQQQINDFNLAGYGDKGTKEWEIKGRSADVFDETVELETVTGNLYGDEEVNLAADKGNYRKSDGKMHLQDNVVITTESGAKLTTDSLDWDRSGKVVSTMDKVNIKRDNMVTVAEGAKGYPDLSKVSLEKNVSVEFAPSKEDLLDSRKASGDTVVITCDGPLDINYEKNFAVFHNNVKVTRKDQQILSDLMEVYFSSEKKDAGEKKSNEPGSSAQIEKIVAKGNVRIMRGEDISYSDEAVYTLSDRKVSLTGRPTLVIYSAEGMDASSGD